jgi:DNA-binding IclR family transcriptional regulator
MSSDQFDVESKTTAPLLSDAVVQLDAAGSSLTRLLQILDLFSLERSTVHVEEVMQAFGIVQSTAYRYLKELTDAGLLSQQGKGVYGLGRRIMELERLLQLSDPLLLAGRPVLDGMAEYANNCALLLCAFYKDAALCVHKVGPDVLHYQGASMRIQRGRGTVLSLFSGAGSQAILAHLPAHQVKSFYLTNARDISKAGLGEDWASFRGALAGIRKRGFARTLGKINPGMHSVAVPVLRPDGKVAGSVLLIGTVSPADQDIAMALLPFMQTKAQEIGQALPLPD